MLVDNSEKCAPMFERASRGVTRLLLLPCTVAKNSKTYTHGQCPSLQVMFVPKSPTDHINGIQCHG